MDVYAGVTRTLVFLLATGLFVQQAYPDPPHYQPERNPKPIVLLLLDTSASMLLTADKHNRSNTANLSFSDDDNKYMRDNYSDYMPECNSFWDGNWFLKSKHYEYSRFMEVLQYLIGDIRATRPWDPPIDSQHPYYLRYMCKTVKGIGHGLGFSQPLIVRHFAHPGPGPHPPGFHNHNMGLQLRTQDIIPDGLIELLGTRARVGLMFMDNDPSDKNSYGPVDSNGHNYGVTAPNTPWAPTILPPDTDDDAAITRTNTRIIGTLFQWLRGTRPYFPHGGSPLASMLGDAYFYFTQHGKIQPCTSAGQTNCDRYADCRPKYVVLFTDGFMNIDPFSALRGDDGWPKKLHDIGVQVIVVTPDGSASQVYETDTSKAYKRVMGVIAWQGGSHWIEANAYSPGFRFIFGMPEFDPGVNSFYPNDTDGANDYGGREALARNLGRPYLANLLGSGSMVNHWTSRMWSNRSYISDLAFTDETSPVTDLAGDPNYIDHYAGVIAGGFYQRGFKLAWQDQVDANVAGNLGNYRITMFGAPYDDGGLHLTFFTCKDHPFEKDKDNNEKPIYSEPGVSFCVDTDSRNWRYSNTDAITDRMKLYTVVYSKDGSKGYLRDLLNPVQPPEPWNLGVEAAPFNLVNIAFRAGDEDSDVQDWHHAFGAFKGNLGSSKWPSSILNIHTGGTELRWIPEFATTDPDDPMRIRRMNTLIAFLSGRPLHCENNSSNTNEDSDCGGGFGYTNTGWYPYGRESDRLRLYSYQSNPTGSGPTRSMLVRFGPTGHFGPVFVGHLAHSNSVSPGFLYFKEHVVKGRPTTLYVQTRDGILHEMQINSLDSPAHNHHRELWRFIPGSLLDKVKYFQLYGLDLSDGPIAVAPVLLSKSKGELGESAADEAQRWRIVLVAGIGRNDVSGDPASSSFDNGMYALDVTDPMQPHLLWEITNHKRCQGGLNTTAITCYSHGEQNDYSDLGYTVSKPAIGMIHMGGQNSGKDVAVAIFGAGDAPVSGHHISTKGHAIFVVNLETGAKIAEFSVSRHNTVDYCGVNMVRNMISGLACYPIGPGKLIRQCVATDSIGRLWVVDLSGGNASKWKAYMAYDPYQASEVNLAFDDSRRAGSLKAPILTRSYGGTLYALYATETNFDNQIDSFDHRNLVTLTRVQIPQNGCPEADTRVWLHLFDQATGERVQGRMALFGGNVYMTTYTPAPYNGCIPGTATIRSVSGMEGEHRDWKEVKALVNSSGHKVSKVSVKHLIPSGVMFTTLPACVQGLDHRYYSTNLPGGNFQNFGINMPGVASPQVIVPMGSANAGTQLGPLHHNSKAQTQFMPAKVIKGGGSGMKTVVIPTSWSLIFD